MGTTLRQRTKAFKETFFKDIVEIPQPLSQAYLPALDGLRGISIIIVICSHFAANTVLTDYFYGDIGVEIFFVISGFLITTLLLKEKVKFKRVSLRKFYVRRALRIVPVSYLFLIVMQFLNQKLILGIPSVNFLASYTYLRNLPLKYTYEWYTGHFWSLSVEEQFYLCFPFLIATNTNKFLIIALVLIAVLPVLSFLGFNNVSVFYSNRIIHVITFAIITMLGRGTASILVGALYAILVFKKIIVIEHLRSNFYMSFILLIVACLILTKVSYLHVDYLSQLIFPFIIGYVILLNIKEKNLLRNILDNSLMKRIGVLSYSLYVWQQLFTAKQAWNLFAYSDTILVRLIGLICVSCASYYLYESFFLRYKARFKSV